MFLEIFILQNSIIKVLSLRGSQVDDLMAEALGKGLIKNFTLLELHLSGNAITVTVLIPSQYFRAKVRKKLLNR